LNNSKKCKTKLLPLAGNFTHGAPRRSLNSAPNSNRHHISNIKSSNPKPPGAIFLGLVGAGRLNFPERGTERGMDNFVKRVLKKLGEN
jgi:hypothetical protein